MPGCERARHGAGPGIVVAAAIVAACQAVPTGGKTLEQFVAADKNRLTVEDIDARFVAAAQRFPALRHASNPGYSSKTMDSDSIHGSNSSTTTVVRRMRQGVHLTYQSNGRTKYGPYSSKGVMYETLDRLIVVSVSSRHDTSYFWKSTFDIQSVSGSLFPLKVGNRMEAVWKAQWHTTSGSNFDSTVSTTFEVIDVVDAAKCGDTSGVTITPRLPGRLFVINQTRRATYTSTSPTSNTNKIGYSPDLGLVVYCGLVKDQSRSAMRFELLPERVAQADAHRAGINEAMKKDFIEDDRRARVIVANAAVMAIPDEESYEVDSFPQGSVVHVIGRLPSGWAQLAKGGKPLGWVKTAGLRMEAAPAERQAAATGAKPSIYLASPKDGDEIAEGNVRFRGYVTVANRTERLSVFVNKLPLSLDHLWTDSAIDTARLRGFPLDLTVPLVPGANRIEIQVLDGKGFLERYTVALKAIVLDEKPPAATADLPPRQANVAVAQGDQAVTAENFIAVLGAWVKDTAKTDYNKGNSMHDEGRFARAAYYYRKSIKTQPMGSAWFNLGVYETALGNAAGAAEAFSKACGMGVVAACKVQS